MAKKPRTSKRPRNPVTIEQVAGCTIEQQAEREQGQREWARAQLASMDQADVAPLSGRTVETLTIRIVDQVAPRTLSGMIGDYVLNSIVALVAAIRSRRLIHA